MSETTLILMECEGCSHIWEWPGGLEILICPECHSAEIHQLVTRYTIARMRSLLAERVVEPERLVKAFAVCTVGGEAFGQAVLDKAVKTGVIFQENGLVRNADEEVW